MEPATGSEPAMILSCRLVMGRNYSRQSIRTGLTPANALSVYWYLPDIR